MTTIKQISQINDYKVRVIAFWVLLSVIAYLLLKWLFFPVLLVLDFGLRSFNLGQHSPFALLSDWIVAGFKLPVKLIYLPPKRFAARVGLVFSVTILLLHLLGFNTLIVGSLLAFFAALESLAGICAGCYVYNWLLPIWQKIGLE